MAPPLTWRLNNPGAIEFGPFAQRYGGRSGGRFAEFPDADSGYRAMGGLLDVYRDKHGLNTIRGIVERWAPRKVDNNSTDGYISRVARDVGIGPDEPLGPHHRQSLMRAMAGYEAGGAPPPLSGSPAPPPPAGPSRMANPTLPLGDYTDPEIIKLRAELALRNAQQRGEFFQSGAQRPLTPLAGLLGGIGMGLNQLGHPTREAEGMLRGNSRTMQRVYQGAAGAKDSEALARMLISSGVGPAAEMGMGLLTKQLDPSAKLAREIKELELAHAKETNPIKLETLKAQLEQAKQKDLIDQFILNEAGGPTRGQPQPNPSTTAPNTTPAPPVPAGGQTVVPPTNIAMPGIGVGPAPQPGPSGAVAPPAALAPIPAAAAPAAPPQPQSGGSLRDVLNSRSPAERVAWLATYKKDPAAAAKILMEWADPASHTAKIASEETAKVEGKAKGEALTNLPKAEASAADITGKIDEVLTDPNLSGVTGPLQGSSWHPTLFGKSVDVITKIEQLGGGAFLQAFEALKGGGQITEVEGKKATDSLARITNRRQSDEGYRKALLEFKRDVFNLANLARKKAGKPEIPLPAELDPDPVHADARRKAEKEAAAELQARRSSVAPTTTTPAAATADTAAAAPPPPTPSFLAAAQAAGIPDDVAAKVPDNGRIRNPKTKQSFVRVGDELIEESVGNASVQAEADKARAPLLVNPHSNFDAQGQFRGKPQPGTREAPHKAAEKSDSEVQNGEYVLHGKKLFRKLGPEKYEPVT